MLRSKGFTRELSARGLWRIDRHRPPEQRRTVLAIAALHDLEDRLGAPASGIPSGENPIGAISEWLATRDTGPPAQP